MVCLYRSMRHQSYDMGINVWAPFQQWLGVTRASDPRLFLCGLELFRAA